MEDEKRDKCGRQNENIYTNNRGCGDADTGKDCNDMTKTHESYPAVHTDSRLAAFRAHRGGAGLIEQLADFAGDAGGVDAGFGELVGAGALVDPAAGGWLG